MPPATQSWRSRASAPVLWRSAASYQERDAWSLLLVPFGGASQLKVSTRRSLPKAESWVQRVSGSSRAQKQSTQWPDQDAVPRARQCMDSVTRTLKDGRFGLAAHAQWHKSSCVAWRSACHALCRKTK